MRPFNPVLPQRQSGHSYKATPVKGVPATMAHLHNFAYGTSRENQPQTAHPQSEFEGLFFHPAQSLLYRGAATA